MGAATGCEAAIDHMEVGSCMGVGLSILLSFVLIVANGFFSMSEMAMVSCRKALLDHEAEEGDRKARVAADLAGNPDAFLSTIQVAITLVGFFSSAVASTNLSDPFAQWMSSFGIGWLSAVAPAASPIVITLIVSYVSMVIGELVPKRIALGNAEGVAKAVAGMLVGFSKVVRPLVWLTSASSNLICKVFHIKEADEGQVSEEEIKYMVSEQEDLSDDEKRMIHDVFDLGDTVVRSVMVPRVDVTGVEDVASAADALTVMRETGYSRLPVYHDDMDEVVGIVNIKALIGPVLAGEGARSVADFTSKAMFVPDSKDLLPLLEQMKAERIQMVVVVDEYGGTAGVVTLEDIVEEIVGDIADEYDDEERELTRVNEREWDVDGAFSIDDAIELGWPIEETDGYETVAGWLIDELDRLPVPGDVLEREGWTFRVSVMDGKRIESLHVTGPEDIASEDGVSAEADEAGGAPKREGRAQGE